MRELSTRMLEAVLDGEGLTGVAELASAEARGPVAIVLPARGLSALAPGGGELNGLAEYARARIAAVEAEPPEPVLLEEPVVVGGEQVGVVLLLAGRDREEAELPVDRGEILRAASLAVLAAVAVSDAREEAERKARGSLIQELRSHALEAADATSKAARLGCDLSRGALALVAEVKSTRPSHAAALVESEYEGSVAEIADGRLYAILPARGGDDAPERTLENVARIVNRLRGHGLAAASSFYPDPAELHRAVREAELVLDVITREPRIAEALEDGIAASGVYRLLFRALISDPEEVKSFYEDTVEPIVRYDTQYRSDLLGTLEEYLASDCNMNATARAIYAHRHTVAYRLDRVRELTGLDPAVTEDRERLGLGIKAYRILAPALPR
ncbi:MAG TPA: helix-turn-helix domain-containing protein [Solirubrobacterales bacterium]|jgi:sugar diacid utilization regulator|nr:helix-turn-helix domain-containing protein [Solirubrobacterales bacterium]